MSPDAARRSAPFSTVRTRTDLERQRQANAVLAQTMTGPPKRKPPALDGSMTVLIAASGNQHTLGAHQVAAAIEEGIHDALPSAKVLKLPDVEANAGFVEEIIGMAGGAITRLGLLGLRDEGKAGRLGLLGRPGDLTAVIAVDEAVDMRSLAPEDRDPTRASSRLAGQLILAALEHNVRRIIIGCGDSGSNDGGIGMANVLGIRFLDAARTEIAEAGGLLRLATIDMTHRDRRLDEVTIEAVVNPSNQLLGAHGVTRVHGARLGASPAQVLRLERGLARYAAVVHETLGIDVATLPGGGASGGLGAGLVAFLGARLKSRVDFLQVCPGLQEILSSADLVITVDDHLPASLPPHGAREAREPDAAGRFNRVAAWVARQAQAKGLPVIALPGEPLIGGDLTAGAGALPVVRAALANGEQATRHASARLREASTAALRRVLSGWNRAAEQA
jgi:glycerate kinase